MNEAQRATDAIAIIDDHSLFVAGLELILRRWCPDFTCSSFSRPDEYFDLVRGGKSFSLIILDFYIPGQCAALTIERIRDHDQSVPIILLTSSISQTDRSEALSAGATEFVQKHTEPEQLVAIIQATMKRRHVAGETRFSELATPRVEGLTQRQIEIMMMVSKGFSNKEVARLLDISPETVKSHLKDIFLRFGLRNRVEAIEFMRSQGLGQGT